MSESEWDHLSFSSAPPPGNKSTCHTTVEEETQLSTRWSTLAKCRETVGRSVGNTGKAESFPADTAVKNNSSVSSSITKFMKPDDSGGSAIKSIQD